MSKPTRTLRAITLVLVLVAGLLGSTAPAASADPAVPAWHPDFQSAVDAFRQEHPHVGEAEAARRIDGQASRARLAEQLSQEYPDEFGGSWYDGATDVHHLQATTPATAELFARTAERQGVRAEVHLVEYPLRALEAEMRLLLEGRHPVLGDAARDHAGIDIEANRAVAALAPAELAAARAAGAGVPQRILTVPRSAPQVVEDVCVDRRNCGSPMRSGIILWRGGYGTPWCSLGFTASAADGSHWAVTAGHCGANFSAWGHGSQAIGPMRVPHNAGNVDVGRIHVQNSYWLQSTWGWLFNARRPAVAVPVDVAITSEAAMVPGETVCLSAWHSVLGNACGILGAVNDAAVRGMARVDRFDACGGDSGGGWYWPSRSGARWAYGIHHGSSHESCHITGGRSWFSTLPDINAHWDRTSAARIRVDSR